MKPGVNPKKGLRILLSFAPNKTLSPENPFFYILLSVLPTSLLPFLVHVFAYFIEDRRKKAG